MPSKLYDTATTFIAAFETLSSTTFTTLQAPTYTHIFAPTSASPPPPLTGTEFSHHIAELNSILRGFPVSAREIFENETHNQVTIWATSETWFHEDVKDDTIPANDWLYHGEYIFILTMDESGEKIERVIEFLDSKGTDVLRGLMKKAKENKAKRMEGNEQK